MRVGDEGVFGELFHCEWIHALTPALSQGERGKRGLLDELELVHVDAVGEAEVAGGEAAAVDHAVLGEDLGFGAGIAHRAADRALGGLDGLLHFSGDAEGGGENALVPLVGEPALGAEALVVRQPALLGRSAAGDPALVAFDRAGDGAL